MPCFLAILLLALWPSQRAAGILPAETPGTARTSNVLPFPSDERARGEDDAAERRTTPLHLIVMDPLALPLSCTCVAGLGQRQYDLLARHLEAFVNRPVKVTFEESLTLALDRTQNQCDLIIGKNSVIMHDAAKLGFLHSIRPLAALTDKQGGTELKGVFLVPRNHPAKSIAELSGKRVSLGPAEDAEAHAAAKQKLQSLAPAPNLKVEGSLDAAALAMGDGEVDAAVVSDFMPPLLEGCGKLEKGSFRVLGETDPVPFVRVFAAASVDARLEQAIMRGLDAVAAQPKLLAAMESKSGFLDLRGKEVAPQEIRRAWPDWRGPGRAGLVPQLPPALPANPQRVWSAPLTGPALAGPAADDQWVVIPDKSADATRDVFHCLNAADGKEIWRLEYAAPDELDYSNAPRATPVMHDGLVYLQGALGHLHCAELASGKILWKTDIYADFGAKRLNWGASIPPLIIEEKLIIAPGAKDASVVALDRKNGKVLWKTPGHAGAYSAFVFGSFDGLKQIIGYDAASLGGWEPQTGQRLWSLVPPEGADFNVTTPVILGNKLLLATENNATRLHRFDGRGKLVGAPELKNKDLAPDTCTPAVVNGKVFAAAYGDLFCLDLNQGLKTLWRESNDMFHEHSNIVASRDRVLLWTMSGDLLLLDATADKYKVLSHLRPFEGKDIDSMAHPAFVGSRVYLRSKSELICLHLSP